MPPIASASGGHKRVDSLLSAWERPLVTRVAMRVPRWLQSHHLTLATLVWSVLVLAVCALARRHKSWLWAMSIVIVLQYLTDAIDGKVGVLRQAGLVRWGFYMDHLLDYVFLCSILLGYALLLPPASQYLMLPLLAIAGGFMSSSFLACAVTGELGISFLKMSPLEVRLVFIAINAWVATVSHGLTIDVLRLTIGVSLAVLCALVYRVQRQLWRRDQGAQQCQRRTQGVCGRDGNSRRRRRA